MTIPTALVLHALAAGRHYGFDIMDATGLPSGTVYPLLRRLARQGLVTARWEGEQIARREGRPARRYYEITGRGEKALAEAADRLASLDALVGRARPRPARGEA